MLTSSYAESKRHYSVVNQSANPIEPFAPCVMIAGSGEYLDCYPITDKTPDAEFDGRLYLLVVNGPGVIAPGAAGRVSNDWPVVARIMPTQIGGRFEVDANDLSPSADGRGFGATSDFARYGLRDYPFSLGYWHWYQAQGFDVVSWEEPWEDVLSKMLRGDSVLARIAPRYPSWESIGQREYPADRETSLVAPVLAELIRDESELPTTVDDPTSGLDEVLVAIDQPVLTYVVGGRRRLALSQYGTYSIRLKSLIRPVPSYGGFGAGGYFRYAADDVLGWWGAVFPGAADGAPVSATDWWRWIYPDIWITANRHDFAHAVSQCSVSRVVHREPIFIRSIEPVENINTGGVELLYLRVDNRLDDGVLSFADTWTFETEFIVKVGRPAVIGTYGSQYKTVLELGKFAVSEVNQRVDVDVVVRRLSSEVDVLE